MVTQGLCMRPSGTPDHPSMILEHYGLARHVVWSSDDPRVASGGLVSQGRPQGEEERICPVIRSGRRLVKIFGKSDLIPVQFAPPRLEVDPVRHKTSRSHVRVARWSNNMPSNPIIVKYHVRVNRGPGGRILRSWVVICKYSTFLHYLDFFQAYGAWAL